MISIRSVALLILAVGLGAAQSPVQRRISVTDGIHDQQWLNSVESVIATIAPENLKPLPAGSLEEKLSIAGKRIAERMFRFKLGTVNGGYTIRMDTGDVLVAGWRVDDNVIGERAVWLWDTPFITTFLIEVSPQLLRPDELPQYVDRTVVWEQSPVMLRSIQLHYIDHSFRGERVVARSKHEEASNGSLQWLLAAVGKQDRSYVVIGIAKAFFYNEYSATSRVRERFPPLAQRLASLANAELIAELGKGYKSPYLLTYPTFRDQLIFRELLSRARLGGAEIIQLLFGDLDGGAGQLRFYALLDEIVRRKELESYVPELEYVCLHGTPERGLRTDGVLNLLGALTREGVDFSDSALRLIENDRYTADALRYIGANGQGRDVLRRLRAARVGEVHEKVKSDAIRAVEGRLKMTPVQ